MLQLFHLYFLHRKGVFVRAGTKQHQSIRNLKLQLKETLSSALSIRRLCIVTLVPEEPCNLEQMHHK